MSTRNPWLLRLALAAAAIALLSLGLACGGDDDDNADAPPATESAGDSTDDGDDSGDDGDGSGDDEPSADLEDYFAEIDAIFEAADAASDELETAFDEAYSAVETVEEAKQVLGEFLLASREGIAGALDDLEDVDPPNEAEDAHSAFIEAGRDLVDISERISDDLQDVETEDDLSALSEDFDAEGTAAAAAADDACFDLQGIADDASIDVDLNCED